MAHFNLNIEKKNDDIKLSIDDQINKLTAELNKKQENYRYLLGNKKGAWSKETEADKKRYNEIQSLKNKINNLKEKQMKIMIRQPRKIEEIETIDNILDSDELIEIDTPEITLDTFKEIAKGSNTFDEFYEKVKGIKNVPLDVSEQFYEIYGEGGQLSMDKAAKKLFKEVNVEDWLNRIEELEDSKKGKISKAELKRTNDLIDKIKQSIHYDLIEYKSKQSDNKSRIETEKINQDFEQRQKELEKYASPEEIEENKINLIQNKITNKEAIKEEIDWYNEMAYLPKGYKISYNYEMIKVPEKIQKPKLILPENMKKIKKDLLVTDTEDNNRYLVESFNNQEINLKLKPKFKTTDETIRSIEWVDFVNYFKEGVFKVQGFDIERPEELMLAVNKIQFEDQNITISKRDEELQKSASAYEKERLKRAKYIESERIKNRQRIEAEQERQRIEAEQERQRIEAEQERQRIEAEQEAAENLTKEDYKEVIDGLKVSLKYLDKDGMNEMNEVINGMEISLKYL